MVRSLHIFSNYPTLLIYVLLILLSVCSISPAWAATPIQFEITGVNDDARANIISGLTAEEESNSNPLTAATIETLYQKAPELIRKALEPYGYFQPTITRYQTKRGRIIRLHFSIQPGRPVLITQRLLTITGPGKTNPAINDFIRHFPLKVGDVFNSEQYEKAKSKLFTITNNQGYLNAILDKKEIRIDLRNHSAIIILEMNTGEPYYFGKFTFTPSPFDPEFLNRFIPFNENEPFSSEKLLSFQQSMNNSKYFQSVSVSPDVDKAINYRVPTQIDLTAPKSRFYNIGLGYGTYTGPRLTMGVDFRRVTDTGQHFNAQLKYSSVLKGLAAKYFIPGRHPLTEQYTIGANVQEFRPKTGKSFSETLTGSYIKTIHAWTHTFSLNLLSEHYNENNSPTTYSHLTYPSYNLAHLYADDVIHTKTGNSFNVTLQGSNEQLFSTTSFIQSEIKDKFIFSPTQYSRVILRGDLGYTVVKELKQLPLTLNYFAGGLNSVRGYEYGSLGPGRYLEVASVELQHRIYGNWNAAVFYDVGNAVDHFNDPLMRGVGVGIIYQSIIGAVQIYLARAESKDSKPLSLEFTIGPDL